MSFLRTVEYNCVEDSSVQGNPWMKDFSEDRPEISPTGLVCHLSCWAADLAGPSLVDQTLGNHKVIDPDRKDGDSTLPEESEVVWKSTRCAQFRHIASSPTLPSHGRLRRSSTL
ncbi:hypothetical protein AVEN_171916-1 [Araneus ventricosus]|uniref:Uncharacterized protein n=1 Tax=Araneus ventricosus TaxID=182803 RepID=A0A4Y2VWR4_ARAVE|nr:hypothetical protein AVEN_171916-1 [Araneus ventricosus]